MPGRDLEPVTTEPTVTQFVPWPCADVTVQATVRCKGNADPIETPPRWMSTVQSREFKMREAFSRTELLGVGLALAFAVVTGMTSEYLKPNLLGSAGDYLALFTWGFVADQAKNILQNIGTTS